MTILGIDPGYATIGFGIVEQDGGTIRLKQYGTINTPAGMEFPQRLATIYRDMNELMEAFHPDVMVVEELFFGNNVTTGIGVAHGRGVILLSAAERNIPIIEYKPSQVKQAVVGYGNAEKKQVMEMTRRILNLDKIPRPDDAADASAIALCHARSNTSLLSRLGR